MNKYYSLYLFNAHTQNKILSMDSTHSMVDDSVPIVLIEFASKTLEFMLF